MTSSAGGAPSTSAAAGGDGGAGGAASSVSSSSGKSSSSGGVVCPNDEAEPNDAEKTAIDLGELHSNLCAMRYVAPGKPLALNQRFMTAFEIAAKYRLPWGHFIHPDDLNKILSRSDVPLEDSMRQHIADLSKTVYLRRQGASTRVISIVPSEDNVGALLRAARAELQPTASLEAMTAYAPGMSVPLDVVDVKLHPNTIYVVDFGHPVANS